MPRAPALLASHCSSGVELSIRNRAVVGSNPTSGSHRTITLPPFRRRTRPPPSPPRAETSEERYRAFIEQTSEGVWRCEIRDPIDIRLPADEQIDLIYAGSYLAECNDAMARMYGLESADQIVGVPLGQLLPRSDPANIEYLRGFIQGGYRVTDAESHEVGVDGRSRYFLNNMIGIVRDGRMIRAWGSQRDITERKRAEAALLASEQRYRALVTASSSLVWTSDAGGHFVAAAGFVGAVHRPGLVRASGRRLDGGAASR